MYTRNTRNMIKVILFVIVTLSLLSIACDESGDVDFKDVVKAASDAKCEQCQNVVDSINRAADDAGIPSNVSGEVYKAVTSP